VSDPTPRDLDRRLDELERTAAPEDPIDEVHVVTDTTADGDPVTIDGEVLDDADTTLVADFTDTDTDE
jgi:hypothetical protein